MARHDFAFEEIQTPDPIEKDTQSNMKFSMQFIREKSNSFPKGIEMRIWSDSVEILYRPSPKESGHVTARRISFKDLHVEMKKNIIDSMNTLIKFAARQKKFEVTHG